MTHTLPLALLMAAAGAWAGSKHDWGYEAHNGPDTWTGTCTNGRRQSPVDVRASAVDYAWIPKMHFANYIRTGAVTVENNGHSVMVSGFDKWGSDRPFIYSGGLDGKYHLLQIHFHWALHDHEGSEHTIGSLHYPVEIHLVHQKDGTQNLTVMPGDGLAVLGVFMYLSKEGTPFGSLEAALKQTTEFQTSINIEQYQPRVFLPLSTDNFYRYDGSLTTPSCSETVIWTVFPEPLPITSFQLQLLRSIKNTFSRVNPDGNFRPTQSLNGRRIKYRANMDRNQLCSDPKSGAGSLWPSSGPALAALLACALFGL